ncbi:MFS transporter [Rhizobium sp. P40RR-XXII]|uniref:MFS transporter n=1 Tax=unclassified Rhizobium TaxID=2613769 RepID=UPI0014575ABD|nr:MULTISPECIES: MFS transporter [unclassified Rhizobium]NLR88870.1 MFS transporter [Rhizobium sp. P28RR-XV]NLS20652.1 MFS transporter [Rhizobium sp. P40RR-XXII]
MFRQLQRSVRWPFVGLQLSNVALNASHAFATVLYPWIMYDLTRSVVFMALVAFVNGVVLLIGMVFGGYIAEMLGIRYTALISAKVGMLTSLLIAILYMADFLHAGTFLILSFTGSILDGPATVATEAKAPEIARLSRLSSAAASSVDDMIDGLMLLTASAASAFVIAVIGPKDAAWWVVIGNFIAMMLLSFSLPRFRLRPAPRLGDIANAGKRLRDSAVSLPFALWGSAALGFFMTLQIFIVPAALRLQGESVAWLGLFIAASATGTIMMNLHLASRHATPTPASVICGALLGLALSMGILWMEISPVTMMLAGLVAGLANGWLSPAFVAILQMKAPRDGRPYVTGLCYSVVLLFLPLEYMLTGLAIGLTSFRTTCILLVFLLSLAAAVAAAWLECIQNDPSKSAE